MTNPTKLNYLVGRQIARNTGRVTTLLNENGEPLGHVVRWGISRINALHRRTNAMRMLNAARSMRLCKNYAEAKHMVEVATSLRTHDVMERLP